MGRIGKRELNENLVNEIESKVDNEEFIEHKET